MAEPSQMEIEMAEPSQMEIEIAEPPQTLEALQASLAASTQAREEARQAIAAREEAREEARQAIAAREEGREEARQAIAEARAEADQWKDKATQAIEEARTGADQCRDQARQAIAEARAEADQWRDQAIQAIAEAKAEADQWRDQAIQARENADRCRRDLETTKGQLAIIEAALSVTQRSQTCMNPALIEQAGSSIGTPFHAISHEVMHSRAREGMGEGSNLALDSALARCTVDSLRSELERANDQLDALRTTQLTTDDEKRKAERELEGYLSRLAESHLDNLPHFRSVELARASRRNNINGVDHDYPCLWEACLIVTIYYIVAVSLVYKQGKGFEGMEEGNEFWSTVYFVVVLTSTVGFGDIYPKSDEAVTLTLYLIFASGFISIFVHIIFGHLLTFMRRRCLGSAIGFQRRFYICCLAALAIFVCDYGGIYGAGNDVASVADKKSIKPSQVETDRDTMCLTYVTLTTVGFGNVSFMTKSGRIFASFWIFFCIPIFAWASTYLMELIVAVLSFLWQDRLKPYLWYTVCPYLCSCFYPAN